MKLKANNELSESNLKIKQESLQMRYEAWKPQYESLLAPLITEAAQNVPLDSQASHLTFGAADLEDPHGDSPAPAMAPEPVAKSSKKTKKGKKSNMFSGLKGRTTEWMHQLLRTKDDRTQGLADMRWERFVKVCLG